MGVSTQLTRIFDTVDLDFEKQHCQAFQMNLVSVTIVLAKYVSFEFLLTSTRIVDMARNLVPMSLPSHRKSWPRPFPVRGTKMPRL